MTSSASLIQHATSVHLSSEDDDPRQARVELLKLVQQFNALLDSLGSAAFKNVGSNEGEIVTLTQGGLLPQDLHPSASSVPTGTLLDFFRRTPPEGWLEANGQTINNQNATHRELFLLLFALATEGNNPLNNLFGSDAERRASAGRTAASAWNNGVSMKLPDLRGRTKVGAGQGTNLSTRYLGSMFGRETSVLEKDHLPNVQLSIKAPLYTGVLVSRQSKYFETQVAPHKGFLYSNVTIDNKTEAMGSDTPHPNMQPYFVALSCIKY